jgi:hypothetical protein
LPGLMKLPLREQSVVSEEQAHSRRQVAFEEALVHLKRAADLKGVRQPSCFISYAWGDVELERWVSQLATNLANAGIAVVFDQ